MHEHPVIVVLVFKVAAVEVRYVYFLVFQEVHEMRGDYAQVKAFHTLIYNEIIYIMNKLD